MWRLGAFAIRLTRLGLERVTEVIVTGPEVWFASRRVRMGNAEPRYQENAWDRSCNARYAPEARF